MIENYLLYPLNINGSFSSIYKGKHVSKNKIVIIKFSNDMISKKLIENEIKFYLFLKKLNFNFIPQIINIGTHNNNKYIITEYKNKTLNFINKDIINQLLNILLFLHNNNIIHRDIKEDNFLIDNNKIFIIDFGLSTFYSNNYYLKSSIGNWKYSSYNCYKNKYIYHYKDDFLSLIYMILNLHNNYIPWTYDTYRKKYDINLNEVYNIEDSINKHFIYLYNNINTINYSELYSPLL